MEWIRHMKLKKALFAMTFISLSAAALLSIISFWACQHFGAKLSSNMVEIRMDSGSLAVTEREVAALSPQEVIAAEILSVLQIVLPIAFFVIAMVTTASLFYHLKLKEPLAVLTNSANRIMENDLDFSIEPGGEDELGQLCAAFETMRQSLLKNNYELWRQAEERRRLNAAFSHDLRNPLTVLKGSVKMARQCAEKGIEEKSIAVEDSSKTGCAERGVAAELLMENLIRMESYTSRIEQYVEAMSSVGRLEEIAVQKVSVEWNTLTRELENAMRFVVTDSGRQFSFSDTGKGGTICLDKNILFQIAENLVSNAVRYAKRQVSVRLILDGDMLSLEVADDGDGFPPELLKNGIKPFQKGSEDAGHFGMGLYICGILCQKHGGSLNIQNNVGISDTRNSFHGCAGAVVCAALETG